MCCDYTNVSLEVLGYELSSSIDTQRFIRLRILILAEPKLNKVTLNGRVRREPIIAAQATKVRHADFPDIDVWLCCCRSIRLQLRQSTFGDAADFTTATIELYYEMPVSYRHFH